MNVLVIILLVCLVGFCGYEVYLLVRDAIKAHKKRKAKKEDDNKSSTNEEVDRKE